MKNRILALLLSVIMPLSLAACKSSSTSTSTVTVSVSQTDEDGNTTTKTTTNEVGVTVGTDGISTTHNVTTETTDDTELPSETTDDTELPSEEDLIDWWYETYSAGAIGENADGDRFLLAYNDTDPITEATLTIVMTDGSLYIREGSVQMEGEGDEEHYVLIDENRDAAVPFAFYDSDEGDFEMFFLGDGDVAVMTVVDQETILGEMSGILEQSRSQEEVNTAGEKSNGTAANALSAGKKADKGYDPDEVRARWESVFSVGAEGMNENGEYFLLAIDDPDDIHYVAFMIMSADLKTLELYVRGEVVPGEDCFVMVDDYSDTTVPFTINNLEDGFEMGFQDGDVAMMYGVPQEKILDDMLAIVEATMD